MARELQNPGSGLEPKDNGSDTDVIRKHAMSKLIGSFGNVMVSLLCLAYVAYTKNMISDQLKGYVSVSDFARWEKAHAEVNVEIRKAIDDRLGVVDRKLTAIDVNTQTRVELAASVRVLRSDMEFIKTQFIKPKP